MTAGADSESRSTARTTDPEGAYVITATGPPSRPLSVLKHNDSFVALDTHGDIGAGAGGSDGFFRSDTRYLSRLVLTFDGAELLLLGSDVSDDNLNVTVDQTNPDIFTGGELILAKDTAHVSRTILVRDGVLHQRVAITNHGTRTIWQKVEFSFDCDFADIFEVRGTRRQARGRLSRQMWRHDTVQIDYSGRDGAQRRTSISFEPQPTELDTKRARYRLELEPGKCQVFHVRVSSHNPERKRSTFISELSGARREMAAVEHDIATVETSHDVVNEVLKRSQHDLYMLTTATEHGPYPYAGIPWYSTTFGRDGLIAAMQMLWFDPRIARGVLTRLAHFQARMHAPENAAEPGKILHEMRDGEMAACREVPFGLYYGSVDSTPLFIILAGRYLQRTGDIELVTRLWPAIERALAWMDDSGDADGDGLLEYAGPSGDGGGLRNQGWKDSHDSVFHADGCLAIGPITLVEVQGYAYLARLLAADCADRMGHHSAAEQLRRKSAALAQRFEASFWCEDLGTYALALDGDKRPCRVRTSNPGHAMFTGIMQPDRAHKVAADLLRPDFLSGWGVRTVAAGEARYNPMSYHNGSIWPHDNAMIASGFARYGLKRKADPIICGVMEAAHYMVGRRLPELYCGFRRRPGRGPTLYPVACAPQAWAAGAPFQLIETCLGLRFDTARRSVVLQDPTVPSFLENITVRNLRLGSARADFRVARDASGSVSLQLLRVKGDLQLSLAFDSGEAGDDTE